MSTLRRQTPPRLSPRRALGTWRVLLRTAGLYVLLVLGLLLGLRSGLVAEWLLLPFKTAVAAASTAAVTLVGVPAIHVGPQIFAPNDLALTIDNECTGLEAVILLVPAILVFPASWRAKAIGVGLGLGVMAVVNFLRVVSLCYVGTYSAMALRMGHLYVWPVVVIVAALVTLLVWVDRFAQSPHT